MGKRKHPTAIVRKIGGQEVLKDPMGFAMVKAVGKVNCRNLFDLNAERLNISKIA